MSKMKRFLEVLMEVIDNLEALSGSLRNMVEALKAETASDSGQESPAQQKLPTPASKPKVTLEQVRAVLADKSQSGHTAEVRELIAKFGSTKLSGIDPAKYAELLKEAEEIGNA